MGPTRKRDLTAAAVLAAVAGYLVVVLVYRYFPPIDVWTGVSLLAVAVGEAGWAFYVRNKINEGEWDDNIEETLGKAIAEAIDDFGPDFDEEGQPLEEGESDRVKDEEQRQTKSQHSDSADDDEEENESEAEDESESSDSSANPVGGV